jgi:hypothetical protein
LKSHAAFRIDSARVGLGYRALVVLGGDIVSRLWIETDYDRRLRNL